MSPVDQSCPYLLKDCYRVILDGRVLGFIPDIDAKKIVDKMRMMKVNENKVGSFNLTFSFLV